MTQEWENYIEWKVIMFQFNYALTEEDYIKFNLHHALHTKQGKQSALLGKLLMPWLCILYLFVSRVRGTYFWAFLIPALLLAVCSILWIVFYEKFILRIIKRNTNRMKKAGRLPYSERGTYTFGEEFIYDNAVSQGSKTSYDLVEAIYTTKDAIYIYNSAVAAYVLPHRFIESQEVFCNFLDFLSAKTNKPVISTVK